MRRATMNREMRTHLNGLWDAIFRVEVDGTSHAVFASYNGDGSWSQWGAPREALSANRETVTAWALHEYEIRSE